MFKSFDFFMPAHLYFGAGSLEKLSALPLSGKALIVTGGTSVKRLGYLDRVKNLLHKRGIEAVVFDKVQPNPIVEHVMEAAELARRESCGSVLGLGGGSSMDSAKAIAVMATNPGHYWDYIGTGTGKSQPLVNKPLPIVCITTTAGTGTEADPWSVITKTDTHEKTGFGHPWTFPTYSIIDPELMVSVPAHLTAYQGFDALFHSIEGYTVSIASPMSDMYALKAIEYVNRYLPIAVKNGADLEARSYVALANTLSGFVETVSSCSSEHAIEHAMSAYHPHLPHGAGLIMISLAYHAAYAPHCPDRYATMASVMGEEASVDGFIRALSRLQEECGVNHLKMSDYQMSPQLFGDYAQTAFDTMGGLFQLDIPNFTQADVIEILEKSYR